MENQMTADAMPPARILFLDIDGVLNSTQWLTQPHASPVGAAAHSGEHAILQHMIDPDCVACLNQILERTGAAVVLSSSWRKKYDVDQIVDVLTARGFRGRIVGVTPTDEKEGSRENEIALWLSENDARGCCYVVLDDEPGLNIHPGAYVRTSDRTGLTDAEAAQAIESLTRNV